MMIQLSIESQKVVSGGCCDCVCYDIDQFGNLYHQRSLDRIFSNFGRCRKACQDGEWAGARYDTGKCWVGQNTACPYPDTSTATG
jgi:hypothetical protein